MADDHSAAQVVQHVYDVLTQLRASPYPVLESPESMKRRASVALIIRISPSSAHWSPTNPEESHELDSYYDLDAFFRQEWVKHGDAEVLFIKRASRKGDRWTSHIALPGGRRDPEDADDKAAAIRETWEEVGIDLKSYALECGNLPQRLVTTHWGKKPLLVLCPYVFILTHHQIPPMKLQPTEVAATHWVPIRSLMSPLQRTVAFEDVSSRIANQETGVKKWMLSLILGKMMFAAINLMPTESLHSVESPGQEILLQDNRLSPPTRTDQLKSLATRLWHSDIFNQFPTPKKDGPLLLWGLTLGVVSDYLDLIPPHNALTLWTYPTFTPLDVRFAVWLLTYRFKDRKRAELQAGTLLFKDYKPTFGAVTDSVAHTASAPATDPPVPASSEEISASTVLVDRPDETGFHGLGTGRGVGSAQGRKPTVSSMLEGYVVEHFLIRTFLPEINDRRRYYDIVRRAVLVAILARLGLSTVLAVVLWRRFGPDAAGRRRAVFRPT
jgi:8-oxo-dGTP pyrophosphatase MutT (NUDIX family)